jgi:putative Mn2+ efflux pump MntP
MASSSPSDPLIIAIEHNNIVDVANLCKGGIVYAKTAKRAWFTACELGKVEVVRALAGVAGADTAAFRDVPSGWVYSWDSQWQGIHIACFYGHQTIMAFLLEGDASLEDSTRNGFTVLHIASGMGHTHIVEWLVGAGADIHARDNYDRSPVVVIQESCHRSPLHLSCQQSSSLHKA